jgi:hypothetical protein
MQCVIVVIITHYNSCQRTETKKKSYLLNQDLSERLHNPQLVREQTRP